MSKRPFSLYAPLVIVMLALALPNPASGQIFLQLWNIDSSSSEREWSYKRKPPEEAILFSWIPELDPATSLGYFRAVCDIDNKKAKNKVIFDNISLTGLDSEETVGAPRTTRLIKKGEGKVALWDLTPFLSDFASDSGVLVVGTVKATKQLKAFQSMRCEYSVWELFDVDNLAGSSEAARIEYFERVIEPAENLSELLEQALNK